MMSISDSYRLLELQSGASIREIQQSYRDLLSVWSPKRLKDSTRLQLLAERKIQEIDSAYDALTEYHAKENQGIVSQSIIPCKAALKLGQSMQFRLVGMNLDGQVVEIDYARWSTHGGTISTNGMFTSQQAGCFTVTAHLGGFQALAHVEVAISDTSSGSHNSSQAPPNSQNSEQSSVFKRLGELFAFGIWFLIVLFFLGVIAGLVQGY